MAQHSAPLSATVNWPNALVSAPGSAPTTSFQFNIPARLVTVSLPVQANAWDLQIIKNIDLVEVLE